MHTILCIEDEPDIRETIAEELAHAGYGVIQAENGEEGLDSLFRHQPDLVLCDINMPNMDGHELLNIVRRDHPDLAEMPFIFLSANADRSQIVAGKELGADDYLTKPIDFDVLIATVKSRLGQIARIKEKHEQQLLQGQKMEAIGRLTTGVAHEFNSLLTAIRGFSEIALRNPDKPELVESCLVDSIEGADRAAAITGQLLAYSRKEYSEPVVVDANSVVTGVERLLKPVLDTKTSVRVALSSEPLPCKIDTGQFFQVLLNLALNARDAMPEGGEITIATSREEITEEKALELPESIPAGSYVCFIVGDSGTGMDEATKSKIFEPFFTTKEEGEGTGLGLAVAYGIVRQAGGIIDCESTLGQGTVFRVYVPEAESGSLAAEEPLASGTDVRSPLQRKRKTILVVDDEDFLRRVTKAMLEDAGYLVLTAGCGESAQEVAKVYPNGIDLLLCDIFLPTDNGPDVLKTLGQTQNGIEAIFMTGNVMTMKKEYPELKDAYAFLEKPFTPNELEEAVSDILVDRQ